MGSSAPELSLDVHMAISSHTPRHWVNFAVRSVRRAAMQAPFPVWLHLVKGVDGHIGQARAHGFAQGRAPYVTFVDDDDYVLPHAFRALHEALLQNPDAVFPRERILQNGKFLPGAQQHAMFVFKREHLIDFRDWPNYGEQAQIRKLQALKFINIPDELYVYRVYPSRARALGRQHRDYLERARG